MKKLICKILGHIKTGKQYCYFDILQTWVTVCPRCQKILMCRKVILPSDESYIASIELDDQSESARIELLSYPRIINSNTK